MSHSREESIKSSGNINLFVRSTLPDSQARAILVIVPGFNSHSGYYDWVATKFAANGLAVFAVDLRGRGQSDGERFYVEDFSDYVHDVDAAVNLARQRAPRLPVFLLGHSAGGVVACIYALEHQAGLAGLVCESFAHQVPAPHFALSVLKGLSHLAPHAHVLKLRNEDFSRDVSVVQKMNADPLIANESQPTQTIAEMVRADERLRKEFPLIKLPILILHGTRDKTTKPSGSKLFFDKAGSTDKTLKLYEGSFHDLLNDADKEKVLSDIQAWIDVRLIAEAMAAPQAHVQL